MTEGLSWDSARQFCGHRDHHGEGSMAQTQRLPARSGSQTETCSDANNTAAVSAGIACRSKRCRALAPCCSIGSQTDARAARLLLITVACERRSSISTQSARPPYRRRPVRHGNRGHVGAHRRRFALRWLRSRDALEASSAAKTSQIPAVRGRSLYLLCRSSWG